MRISSFVLVNESKTLCSPEGGPLAPDVLLGVDEGVGGPGDLLLGGVALHAAHRVRGLTAALELGLAPEEKRIISSQKVFFSILKVQVFKRS